VLVTEQFADGQASEVELRQANLLAQAAWVESSDSETDHPAYLAWGNNPWNIVSNRQRVIPCSDLARLLRDLFGNPFRPRPPKGRKAGTLWRNELASLQSWNDGLVVKLAQSMYDGRVFDAMPILADALEESGCTDIDVLNHCRQSGEHVNGCWVIDLLLGKK
jgi:hypothetical protein